jgi:hypothetical protein
MDMSTKGPSKPRVMVYFMLPRERAPQSSAQQVPWLQLSGRTSQYFYSNTDAVLTENSRGSFVTFAILTLLLPVFLTIATYCC